MATSSGGPCFLAQRHTPWQCLCLNSLVPEAQMAIVHRPTMWNGISDMPVWTRSAVLSCSAAFDWYDPICNVTRFQSVCIQKTSHRGHPPSRRLVLVGTQHDSIPPTELGPVRCTAIDGSDTDIVDPPAFAETDTDSMGHNSDDAGGEVSDFSTESETEHVPSPSQEQQRVLSRPQAFERILIGRCVPEACTRHEVCAPHHARGLRIRCPCGFLWTCQDWSALGNFFFFSQGCC